MALMTATDGEVKEPEGSEEFSLRSLFSWVDLPFALAGFLLATILYYPSLTGERAYLPADHWLFFPPFNSMQPDGYRSFEGNGEVGDMAHQGSVYIWVLKETIAQGELPLWNPYFQAGMPLLGNGQSAPLSPVNLPHWLVPWPYNFAWAAWLRIGVLFAGCYLFSRVLGVSRHLSPAVAVGGTFAAGFMVWNQHPNVFVYVFLPWVLFAVEWLCRLRTLRGMMPAALTLALLHGFLWLGGHMQVAVNSATAAGLYLLLRAPWTPWRQFLLIRGVGGAALVAGLALASPAIVEFAEFAAESSTLEARADQKIGTFHHPPRVLETMWNPYVFGANFQVARAFVGERYRGGSINIIEDNQYIGVVGLVILAAGLLFGSRKGNWLRLAGLAAVCLFAATLVLGIEPFHRIIMNIPPFYFNRGHRAAYVLHLMLVLLGGLLLNGCWLKERHNAKPWHWILFFVLLTVGISAAVWAARFGLKHDYERRAILLFYAAVSLVAAGFVLPRRQLSFAPAALLFLLYVSDVGPVWHRFHQQVPVDWARVSQYDPALFDPVDKMNMPRLIAEGAIHPNHLAFFGIQDVRAYDYPEALRNDRFFKIFDLDDFAFSPSKLKEPKSLAAFSRCGTPLLFTSLKLPTVETGGDFGLVSKTSVFNVYLNPHVHPLAEFRTDGGWVRAGGMDEAIKYLEETWFDMKPAVVIETENVPSRAPDEVPSTIALKAKYTTNRRILVDRAVEPIQSDGFVILRVSYDDGWKAWVDGVRAPVYPADVKWMAIPVKAGVTKIELRYSPNAFWVSLWISIAGHLAVGAGFVWLFFQRRRRLAKAAL